MRAFSAALPTIRQRHCSKGCGVVMIFAGNLGSEEGVSARKTAWHAVRAYLCAKALV